MNPIAQFFRDHPEYDGVPKQPAWFSITYLPLAANAVQAQADVTTSADAEFVACGSWFSQTTATTNVAYISTPLIINLVFQAYNQSLINVKGEGQSIMPFPQANGTGDGWWAYPLIVPRATQISAITDNPQAVAANVFITFRGFKVFTSGRRA